MPQDVGAGGVVMGGAAARPVCGLVLRSSIVTRRGSDWALGSAMVVAMAGVISTVLGWQSNTRVAVVGGVLATVIGGAVTMWRIE